MRMRRVKLSLSGDRAVRVLGRALTALALLGVGQAARGDAIPYPNSGMYNPVTYTFTATTTGDIVAYFAGSGASFDNQLGLLVNGVQQGGFGLDDHTSNVGDSFDFGSVTAGSTLVFILNNLTLGKMAYSDPSLNVAYDDPGETIGHNHIYSTAYTATSPIFAGVPPGVYVAFEDLPFPNSDFNYNDETFVFTNVSMTVPEPSTFALLGLGAGGLAAIVRRRKSRA
jgi:hypothetical protein